MLTKADIEKYFIAEKQESLLFLVIGVVAIALAVVALTAFKTGFWKGAALPLLLIGLIQFVVGFTVYTRSDKDRTSIVYAYDMNPSDIKNKELPRMQTVNKKFIIYRWVEIALAITGIIVALKFKGQASNSDSWGSATFWYGLGIFLTIQSLLMLGADYFAEKRAIHYTNLIEQFVKK